MNPIYQRFIEQAYSWHDLRRERELGMIDGTDKSILHELDNRIEIADGLLKSAIEAWREGEAALREVFVIKG